MGANEEQPGAAAGQFWLSFGKKSIQVNKDFEFVIIQKFLVYYIQHDKISKKNCMFN